MLPIPFGTDRPQRRFPWMNVALIAANVVIFFLSNNLGRHAGPGMAAFPVRRAWLGFMLDPANPHLYQFITYQFLHEGWMHIGFNMLFLYVFGNNLNEKLGHLAYLLFYLAGGVLAGCGQMAISNAPTLGASGSISAVTGLFLALLPRIHIKLFVWIFVYVDVWEIPSMYFILFEVAQNIFEEVMGSRGVAYTAHLSGAAAGFLIGLLLLGTKLVQRDHYDILAMLNRFRKRQEYRTIVSRGYDPFSGRGAGARGGGDRPTNVMSTMDPRIESLRAEVSRLLRVHQTAEAAARYLELRAIDTTQVLASQDQVDVASQLMAERRYAEAAAAYEGYLAAYPMGGAGQQDQITLMLGLIYARYVKNPERARELLQKVLPGLHNPGEREMAEGELRSLGVPPAAPPPGPG